MRRFGQNNRGFRLNGKIVQCGHQRPAVHLGLVDLLGAVIKPSGIAQANGVGCGKQTKLRMRRDNFVLIHQGQLAIMFKHPLDHKHHVGAAGVIFIKHNGHRIAQRPRQDTFVKLGHLQAVFKLDRILTDQIDAADVAVKVYPHRRPV